MAKKKEKRIPKVGITGVGEDYSFYKMSIFERISGYIIGFFAGFAASYVMYKVPVFSLIVGVTLGFVGVPIYQKYLLNKRQRLILIQFRDLLDSLSNSFSAGKNTPDAFADAYTDIKMSYGDSPMTNELSIINNGLHNNFVIEDLLRDLSLRCGIDDINSFAETFAVCNRLGGNLKKVVSESRDIISDKIEIELEIQTTVAGSKNEINIMCAMPFVIVGMMGMLGEDAITANTPINVIVKIIALGMFAFAYSIGKKITDIKV